MALYRVYPPRLTKLQRYCFSCYAMVAATSVFLLDRLYAYHRERQLRNAFRKGAVPSPEGFVVERKELAATVKRILDTSESYRKYTWICGKQGTGKTTLIRQVGHEYSGIVYVPLSEDSGSFEEAFARAINWSPPKSSTWLSNICQRILGTRESEECEKPKFCVPQ